MPVRIDEMARKHGLDSRVILAKAKSLGIAAAKTPSSSLDKISAEWLEEELVKTNPNKMKSLPKPKPVPPVVEIRPVVVAIPKCEAPGGLKLIKNDPPLKNSPAKFIRLPTEQERKGFYVSLKGSKWWLDGQKRSSTFSWVNIFEKSDGKCVYCSRDLATSTDALAESTEEHLVPRSLLEANGEKCDNEHNMAVCCAGCNGLKGELLPPASHPCWNSRKAFIKECSRFVAECRLNNFQKYKAHVEKVLKKRAGVGSVD